MSQRLNIAIGRVWQETNTFSEVSATLEGFQRHRYKLGTSLLDDVDGYDDELAGFADALTDGDVNVGPLIAANCWCGGPATESLVDTILNDVRVQLRTAADLDAVLFSMHGAMASKDTRDVEGAIAALIRSEIGPEIPLVLTLDHHANVTTNIVESCDILTAYRHCPHTDMFETGRRGASLMLRLLRGEISPATAFCKLPLVTPCERFMTADGPMATWFELARDAAENSEIVDVSLFPVQPWLDVPDFGWSVVVTSNNDPGLAETICAELAQAAWDQRDEFFVEKLTPTDAVRRAAAAANGPVVIADGADATNGGSPGDSKYLDKITSLFFNYLLLVILRSAAKPVPSLRSRTSSKLAAGKNLMP